jgi:hypothetical protein
MLNLYRKSQAAQINWIRSHPVQYVVLNATLLAALWVYVEYKDRQRQREFETIAPEIEALKNETL